MPFSWFKMRAGLLQMIIWRAAAVRGGIGNSSSCLKIDLFFCKIRFGTHIIKKKVKITQKIFLRTHIIIIQDKKQTKKIHEKLSLRLMGVNAYNQPDCKMSVFFETFPLTQKVFGFCPNEGGGWSAQFFWHLFISAFLVNKRREKTMS